jgi:hypothetical protein
MHIHRILLVATLTGIVALAAGAAAADPYEAPAKAVEACKQRSVEGSRYSVDKAKVIRVVGLQADRLQIDIESPAGNIRCVVTPEGEIFSADEIEEE